MTRPLIDDLRTADTLVIGAPMYNYSVPALLKAWIDRVSFPGAFVEDGTSVFAGKRVVLISSRGGAYGPGSARTGQDFELPYLRMYFARHGVRDENVRVILAEHAMAGLVPQLAGNRADAAASLVTARAAVRAAARDVSGPPVRRGTRPISRSRPPAPAQVERQP